MKLQCCDRLYQRLRNVKIQDNMPLFQQDLGLEMWCIFVFLYSVAVWIIVYVLSMLDLMWCLWVVIPSAWGVQSKNQELNVKDNNSPKHWLVYRLIIRATLFLRSGFHQNPGIIFKNMYIFWLLVEQQQRLAADERKREYHEEQRNEFENYAEEEHNGEYGNVS